MVFVRVCVHIYMDIHIGGTHTYMCILVFLARSPLDLLGQALSIEPAAH